MAITPSAKLVLAKIDKISANRKRAEAKSAPAKELAAFDRLMSDALTTPWGQTLVGYTFCEVLQASGLQWTATAQDLLQPEP